MVNMYEDEGVKPNALKIRELPDLFSYAQRKGIKINKPFLQKYGFKPDEVIWILEKKAEEIKMIEEKIQADRTNEQITRLLKENKELKDELEASKNNTPKRPTRSIQIKEDPSEWRIVETVRPHKHGEPYRNVVFVSRKNVDDMRDIVKLITKDRDKKVTGYREVVSILMTKYNLSIDIESFNGGKNRAKYYFPLYYYPLKILEYCKEIKYNGGGKIEVL